MHACIALKIFILFSSRKEKGGLQAHKYLLSYGMLSKGLPSLNFEATMIFLMGLSFGIQIKSILRTTLVPAALDSLTVLSVPWIHGKNLADYDIADSFLLGARKVACTCCSYYFLR
jgi:hypothetical protein